MKPKAKGRAKALKPANANGKTGDLAQYINREFSWLQFNLRVLEEAANPQNPLLERLKFLAIFESNLDEFYMVRVSGLIEQMESGSVEPTPDGLTPAEQLRLIAKTAQPMRKRAGEIFERDLKPRLAEHKIVLRNVQELTSDEQKRLDDYFRQEVFPVCTPLILHPASSVPFISNRSLNLAVEVSDPKGTDIRLARVKVPTVIPRFVPIHRRKHEFVLLEDIIAHNIQSLFPGMKIRGVWRFRVLRDADVEIRELEAADLLSSVEETIRLRRFGDPVLLEVSDEIPDRVRKTLMGCLLLDPTDVFEVSGILGLEALWELNRLDVPGLRFPPLHPILPDGLASADLTFQAINKGEVFLHHPYASFRVIEDFVASAASDPNVIGIKQTLYRVGAESPIVESLLDAAEAGKQVAVMVELKARFDESNNLVWARALERAGVHVTYGFSELKTHCKLCLIVRRVDGQLKMCVHVGTGNYNPTTARLYTDFGLMTADPEITADVLDLFNYLTGFSKQETYRKLLVAPINLREQIIKKIQREIICHRATGKGRVILKLNALVDPEVIDALYEASSAGVKVDLIVRGICCLRAGVPGLSENITVVSVVGRFLEHSRACYFENAGKPELYLGSADLMRRNLDRRVEVLAPVENPELISHIRQQVLELYLRDNVKAWRALPDGRYERVSLQKGQERFEVQTAFLSKPSTWQA